MKNIKIYAFGIFLVAFSLLSVNSGTKIQSDNNKQVVKINCNLPIEKKGKKDTEEDKNNIVNNTLADYSVEIMSYTKNLSYIEYPQIIGLEDMEKASRINKILEEQVLYGAKNYRYENFVDFDIEGVEYMYSINVGFCNNEIASFNYDFDAGDTIGIGTFGTQGHTSRRYGVTIDMETGEKIELTDFMIVDNRLIDSDDGTDIEANYESAAIPIFHNFKDAFMVSDDRENEDSFHIFTYEQTIENLKNIKNETNWYIDSDKNIVFFFTEDSIKIPYTQIKDIIYSKYIAVLEN